MNKLKEEIYRNTRFAQQMATNTFRIHVLDRNLLLLIILFNLQKKIFYKNLLKNVQAIS